MTSFHIKKKGENDMSRKNRTNVKPNTDEAKVNNEGTQVQDPVDQKDLPATTPDPAGDEPDKVSWWQKTKNFVADLTDDEKHPKLAPVVRTGGKVIKTGGKIAVIAGATTVVLAGAGLLSKPKDEDEDEDQYDDYDSCDDEPDEDDIVDSEAKEIDG